VNKNQAAKIVVSTVQNSLPPSAKVTADMQLIGGESLLDSMKLVEVCLALEDVAEDHGFEFDWTSDSAMSKSRSIFRTVQSLIDEFAAQARPK